MSVDQTISELSGTLAQLSTLVAHINGQINGITSRINLTLDNFDQVPNSWVFYMLFITLIVVFILLSVVLILNLITKVHAIVRIVNNKDGTDRALISTRNDPAQYDKSSQKATAPYSSLSPISHYTAPTNGFRNHVSIAMEHEPRRVGMPLRRDSADVEPRLYQRRGDEPAKYIPEDNSSYARSLEV
ncbi:unnamed protein product [Nippostrongylus brasiliensis]|uniref:Movement protein n=1 Tax=Nippostrongylus brasiliensis TaxID=27835 RepID=A0A0N4XG08_NIPBR|nr:unnamed protein product [Nippostrongylus brasiliensis]